MNIFFSVVVPLYNQLDQLRKTLELFSKQTFTKECFEVIVVNDGSTDFLESDLMNLMQLKYPFLLVFITITHSGSGAARNAGAKIARGQYLVFCDADRMPDKMYLSYYLEAIKKNDTKRCVFQGRVKECFAVNIDTKEYSKIVCYSRDNQYYHKIMNIYMDSVTSSGIQWASYMVGNSCIAKCLFDEIGGFDEQFIKWGFEHFDLGVRLMEEKVSFISVVNAVNYHIPHSKKKAEYKKLFMESIDILNSKYKQYNHSFIYLVKYLCGEISLQEFEYIFSGINSEALKTKKEIFYQL